MGSIYRRGKVYWIGYIGVDGRRYLESSGSHLKDDAKTLLRLREGDIVKGIPVTPAHARLTFDEAVQDVLRDYEANGRRSLSHVQRRIQKHLLPFFGGRRLASITTADIRAYVTQRQAETFIVWPARTIQTKNGTRQIPEIRREVAGISNAEINRELAIVKRTFVLAMQAGRLLHRPHIPMLDEDNVRQGFFELDQMQAVRGRLSEPLQPVVAFAYMTGWRVPSEVLPLEWRQVDFGAGTVILDVGRTKNREGRTFVMTKELRQLLEHQRTKTTETERRLDRIIRRVFHREGEPIKNFRKAWTTACTKAGLPGRIPHDFRRTAVRNLVRAGVPERVAMTMTGHKTRSVFERYNIVSEADLLEAARKLDIADMHAAATQKRS